jgi:SHS2 domain-containing protein
VSDDSAIMVFMVHSERGHRVLPHTADVILEAWGPDFASCCEEAVAALADVYVDAGRADTVERRQVHLGAGSEESLLLEVLEEVIFTLDTADAVPVRAEVRVADDAGLDVVLSLAERRTVTPTGSVPKAVSRSELVVDSQATGVRCRFLVDV